MFFTKIITGNELNIRISILFPDMAEKIALDVT